MQPTSALARAAHPLTLAAASLVLLNDLVLRPLWPAAWWTGKLSTLAAAFALPLLLAAFLSFFLPRRQKLAAGLAFGSVLLGLLLLKASPQTNHWLTGWLPLRAVPDPGDLLAVFPWLAALVFYFRPARFARPLPALRVRLLLLPLAALFLLADAAMPDYGVTCLKLQDSRIVTPAGYQVYFSADSGRTWDLSELPDPPGCSSPGQAGLLELASVGDTRYRVATAGAVERSRDGNTWETVYTAAAISEPEQIYLRRTITSNLDYLPGPFDAVVDPQDGSLIVAMGLQGVLIVPPTGEPTWVAVGPYRHNSLRAAGLNGYLTVLGGEIWLAFAAALTWLATASLRLRRSTWQMVVTGLGWLLLVIVGLAQHPEVNTGYMAGLVSIGLLLTCAWSLALVIIALIRLRGQLLRAFAPRILFAPLFIVVILLPYIAWAAGLLPSYWLSIAIAAVLAFTMVILTFRLSTHTLKLS